jgi:hypothetical protein
LAACAAVGIVGVIITIAALAEDNAGTCPSCSDPSYTWLYLLLVAGLLLWGAAVAGWAVRKGSTWPASLIAGLVACLSVFGTYVAAGFVLFVVAFATFGAG